MADLFFQLQEEAMPALRRGDLDSCDKRFCEYLRSLPDSPFHIVLDLHFTNDPDEPEHFYPASIAAGLLVVSRYQQLIARAASLMPQTRPPILSTSHDHEFIAEI